MDGRWSRFPAGILLITFAVALWGAAAYLRMPVELLPPARDRLVIVVVEAPGHAAAELSRRFGPRAAPLFRKHAFACDVEARYVSHGFTLSCRTPGSYDLPERTGALRRGFAEELEEAGLGGAVVRWFDEPLAERATLRVGFPEPRTEVELNARVERLRSVRSVSAVRLLAGPAAWQYGKAYRVAVVERDEGAGPVGVSASVRRLLVRGEVIFGDQAAYVRASESNLFENIVGGTLLTIVCVYVFLRSVGSTLLVGVSIPLCVILSIPFLVAFDVSRNVMSLSGLALSVGIVVDASLSIVSEFRERMATGRYTAAQAAVRTVGESYPPLLVATLSTLAVFVPILFLEGRVGELFSELSKAVIVSNVVGLFVSLIVVPCLLMVAGRWDSSHPRRPGALPAPLAAPHAAPLPGATPDTVPRAPFLLSWSPWIAFCASSATRSFAFLGLSALALAVSLEAMPSREFLPPPRDGNGFAEVAFSLPSEDAHGSEARELGGLAGTLEAALTRAGATAVLVSAEAGRLVATFQPGPNPLSRTREDLERAFPGRRVFAALQNPLRPSTEQRTDVSFYFRADAAGLDALSRWLEAHPGLDDRLLSTQDTEPVNANPWRNAFELEATAPRALERRYLEGPAGLDAGRALRRDPKSLTWIGDERWEEGRVKIRAGETTLGFQDALAAFTARSGIALRRSAAAEEAEASLAGLARCLLLAVGIILALLWIQNRSLSKSLIILATFAWAPLGAVPALRFHGETLNGSALVGFILLAGTIVNNGILLMDRIEKNLQLQMSVFEASLAGVRERSLNVVVTGLTTVLAMLPMIFGGQEGAQMYRSLSVVVVYGTIASTPVSFLGIPALLVARQGVSEFLARLRLRARVSRLRDDAARLTVRSAIGSAARAATPSAGEGTP